MDAKEIVDGIKKKDAEIEAKSAALTGTVQPLVRHALLECPECGQLVHPTAETSDGGAYYRCQNRTKHGDFKSLKFRIDGDGELYF